MLLSLIAIMVFFQFMTDGTLFKPVNLTNLVLQNSYIIIMALGMLLVIVAGHIDLSVGSVSGFIGALAAVMMVELASSALRPGRSIVCLVARRRRSARRRAIWSPICEIPVLHRHAGRHAGLQGLSLALLGGQSVGPFPPEFQQLSSGFIPDLFGGMPMARRHVTSMLLGVVGDR